MNSTMECKRYVGSVEFSEEDGSLCLQIKIFAGDPTDKYLTKAARQKGLLPAVYRQQALSAA